MIYFYFDCCDYLYDLIVSRLTYVQWLMCVLSNFLFDLTYVNIL